MTEMIDKIEMLKNTLVATATGSAHDISDYVDVRSDLIADKTILKYVPDFVRQCRTLGEFWEFIKHKFPSYHERRVFIWDSFKPLLDFLETASNQPIDKIVSDRMTNFGMSFVQEYWDKALDRREADPEGAITASRTLIETVCKHILDKLTIEYDSKIDLPELYRKTAKNLNLSPEDHQEEIFKQILSGCISVINGLGSLRNQISDAHGKKSTYVKPSTRHATLVVNLSGTMAQFLMDTYEHRVK